MVESLSRDTIRLPFCNYYKKVSWNKILAIYTFYITKLISNMKSYLPFIWYICL